MCRKKVNKVKPGKGAYSGRGECDVVMLFNSQQPSPRLYFGLIRQHLKVSEEW